MTAFESCGRFHIVSCCQLTQQFCYLLFRTHANGSIKRGSKDNATDAVQLRTGIGVQLKDIKVFNRARQQGRNTRNLTTNHKN